MSFLPPIPDIRSTVLQTENREKPRAAHEFGMTDRQLRPIVGQSARAAGKEKYKKPARKDYFACG